SIDGVNGGQPITSSSNTVSGYIPGVTLALRSASATPTTVTVSQNTDATVQLVHSFVDAFNGTLDAIDSETNNDPTATTPPPLAGDPGLEGIENTLRSLTSSAALGATGTYRSLADIGISTGATGAAVGTTNRLQVDDAKLAAALNDNPQAVQSV